MELELPLEEHPTLLILPTFNMPGLVAGRPIAIPGFAGFWGEQLVNVKELVEKRPFTATPFIDLVCLCQMIAKIGHAYAIAILGEDLFSPMLTDFVRRKFSDSEQYPDCYHLVGGLPQNFAPSPGLHQIGLSFALVDEKPYVLIPVRLFGNLGAPIFMAVVGSLRDGVTLEQVFNRAQTAHAARAAQPRHGSPLSGSLGQS